MANIREVISLKTFPKRSTYTSSVAYGAAVEQWLGEQMQFSDSLNLSIADMNILRTFLESLRDAVVEDKDIVQRLKNATVSKAKEVAINAATVDTQAQEVETNTTTVNTQTQEVAINTASALEYRNEAEALRNQAQQIAGGDIVSSQIKFPDNKSLDTKMSELDNKYLGKTARAVDSTKLVGRDLSLENIGNTVPLRDATGDIFTRLFRSTYPAQTTGANGNIEVAFRNSATDNYIRFLSATQFKNWALSSVYKKGEHLSATATGNNYDSSSFEALGNGVADTIKPSIGFHQPGKFAGTIIQENAYEFRFLMQNKNYATIRGGAIYAEDWIRPTGNTGLYFQSHGGGWHMTDVYWIRAYNNKKIYVSNNHNDAMLTEGGVRANVGFWHGGQHLDDRYLMKTKIRLNGTTGYIDA